jgi:spore germination protein YaaH
MAETTGVFCAIPLSMRALPALVPVLLLVSCQTITEPDILEETPPSAAGAALSVIGYHAWWSGSAWERYDYAALDAVYFFSLEVGPDGQIEDDHGWPGDWRGLIATARATETSVLPSVTILDSDVFTSVFSSASATDTLLAELTRLAIDPSADGVHLDFEMFDAVSPDERQAVTDLVARLRIAVDEKRPGTVVTMYTLAEDPAGAFDEPMLAPNLDRLIVQAYDLHWRQGGTAGPVAPVDGWGNRNWHAILARYEAMGISRDKMLFTIPYFGYEWPTDDFLPGSQTTGPGIVLAYANGNDGLPSARDRASLHGKLRDVTSGSPYYAYRDSLGWRQGWFDDALSISDKYEFVIQQGLSGVAIFPLAYGDGDLLAALSAARTGTDITVAP